MAEYSTAPQLDITDTFSTLVTDFNTVSSGLGATGDLTTNVKTTIVGAINELEVGIRGVSNNLVATDLLTNANDLVGAINEIEDVFDASAKGISAGSYAFDITTTNASGISLAAPVVSLTGDLTLVDGERIKLGTGADLQIYHDGNNSIIDETGEGNLFVRATNVNIQNRDADPDENMAVFNAGGSVDLYHDNAKKFETTSSGASITGQLELSTHLDMPDAAQIKLGNDDDFILQHIATDPLASGSVSLIQGEAVKIRNLAGTETMASFNANGSTNLFYDNSAKLSTTSDGIDITGIVNLDTDAVIKGGTATAITLDNANVTIAGNTTVSGTLSVGSLTTTNQTVKLAIDELHTDIGTNATAIGNNATAISANTTARTNNATNISTNTTAIGTLTSLNSAITVDRTNLVAVINELQQDITQINTSGADGSNDLIGTLAQLTTTAQNTVVAAINELDSDVGVNTTKLSGIDNGADVNLTAAQTRTLIGTGNNGVVPSAGSVGEFLKHDGTFGTPSYTTNTDTTYTAGIGLVLSGTQFKVNLNSETVQSIGANNISSTSSRTYSVQRDSQGDLVVNVPWVDTDTNTTYTVGNGGLTTNDFTNADHTKLDGIATGATADQTKADIDALNIDADTLDGQHGSYYATATSVSTNTGNIYNNDTDIATNASGIATNVSGISNINTKLGTISSVAMGTTASNVSDAIVELRLSIPTIYNAAGTALN